VRIFSTGVNILVVSLRIFHHLTSRIQLMKRLNNQRIPLRLTIVRRMTIIHYM